MNIEEYTQFSRGNIPDLDYRESYIPLFFSLPLGVFKIPKNCPPKVRKEIRSSFSLFFADPSAALNHIRSAVDILLTHYHVKKFDRSKRQFVPISLHKRIESFGKMKPEIAQKLLAIKWIGNAGSHPTKVEKGHALDAYELLEDVLLALFEKKELRIRRLVNQVNKRKGPLKPQRDA